MSSEGNHFSTITEYFEFLGKAAPEHPLVACIDVEIDATGFSADCPDFSETITTDFYIISLKNIIAGEVLYGKTRYDSSNGTMVFVAPGQKLSSNGIRLKSEGRILLIHPDFFLGHAFEQTIKNCAFFEYAINEALHLSPNEEKMAFHIFDTIAEEYHSRYDDCSREIILSHINTLLTYSERFYKRQFRQRQDLSESIHSKFRALLESYITSGHCETLPNLGEIADSIGLSNRYLSDAIKAETGKSAKECMQIFIIDKAKGRLINTNDSITTISYELGFSSPQYFVRLFKKKAGKTPSEFRKHIH